jgi:hypothetical protein
MLASNWVHRFVKTSPPFPESHEPWSFDEKPDFFEKDGEIGRR